MKFVIDDRLKHRVTGVIVLVSILAVFLPAMMKKSNQRFEESLNLTMRLPEKPALPVVAMPKADTMFKTVNVAHVDIDSVAQAKGQPAIAKAEPLTAPSKASISAEVPQSKIAVIPVADKQSSTKQVSAKLSTQYAVQLASFSQQHNAQLLVNKLRSKGYKATYNKLNQKNGTLYKVVVGQINEKNEAITLQKKLAQAMQINGFVVKTGVS